MYDYRKDIIDIIKGTNPSVEGIEAVQSIVSCGISLAIRIR